MINIFLFCFLFIIAMTQLLYFTLRYIQIIPIKIYEKIKTKFNKILRDFYSKLITIKIQSSKFCFEILMHGKIVCFLKKIIRFLTYEIRNY